MILFVFQVLQVVGYIEFVTGTQNQIDSLDVLDLPGPELCIASHDDDVGSGIVVYDFAYQLPAFFFGHVGNAASVYDKDVCLFFFAYRFGPCFFQAMLNGRCLRKVEFASQCNIGYLLPCDIHICVLMSGEILEIYLYNRLQK